MKHLQGTTRGRLALVVAIVVALWFLLRNLSLIAQPWPLDYDGFYYLVELRSYRETWTGHYSAYLPFFAVLDLVTRPTGLAPEQVFHAAVVGTLVLFGLGIATLAWDARNPHRAALLLVVVWGSQALCFTHQAFLKQAAGMTLLAWSCVALQRLHRSDATVSVRWAMVAALLALLTSSFHKFSALVFAGVCLSWSRLSRAQRAVCVAIAALGLVFLVIDHVPEIHGLGRTQTPSSLTLWRRGQISAVEVFERLLHFTMLAAMLLYALRARLRRGVASFYWLAVCYVALLLPMWGSESGRMSRSAVWLVCLAAALFLRLELPARGEAIVKDVLVGAAALLLVLATLLLPRTPHVLGPGMSPQSIADATPIMKAWIPPTAFVQAPHGVQFRVTYFWQRASARRPPEGTRDGFTIQCAARSGDDERECPRVSDVSLEAVQSVECVRLDDAWLIARGPLLAHEPPRACPRSVSR